MLVPLIGFLVKLKLPVLIKLNKMADLNHKLVISQLNEYCFKNYE